MKRFSYDILYFRQMSKPFCNIVNAKPLCRYSSKI